MTTSNQPRQAFLVRVGHWELRLKAHDSDEAIRLARLQMARELPRLYDVIRSLAAVRFQVEAAA
ncbi:MAG TPA: hypothetical protein VHE81_13585 [Lacipirellulaceae bacterium]|nr:hypothetical protein [Lacipirellulaceae bacterium]